MSIIVVVRDYLDQIRPFFCQDKSFQNNVDLWSSFLKSFFVYFEAMLPSRFLYVFSFQWRKDLVYIPICRPRIQITRSSFERASIAPLFCDDPVSKDLSFPIIVSTSFKTAGFQNGFFNAFFLAFPRSLSFLVSIRRYWLQGFEVGLRSTIGYRRGETLLFISVINGFRPLWWRTSSPLPLSIGILGTCFILWESISHKNFSYWKVEKVFFISFQDGNTRKSVFKWFFQYRYLFYVRFGHRSYAWIELGTLFRTFSGQAFDIQEFSNSFLNLLFNPKLFVSYGVGFFFGGLFFDFLFRIRAFISLKRFFLRFHCPPIEWKQKFHQITRYFIVAFSFIGIPYYSADYLFFSSLGLFGRDTEIGQRVTRNAFNYPITPGKPLSFLFEGRNIMGEDSYGRPSPDIIRSKEIGRLAIEASRDLVDETYRTQQTNQRVDSVYLGALERKIFEWLSIRNPKNSTRSVTSDRTRTDQNKKVEVSVAEPVRKGIGSHVTPRTNPLVRKIPQINIERSLNRFDRWFRATRPVGTGEGFFTGRFRKFTEGLTVLRESYSSQEPYYLASIGLVEPQKTIRYSDFTEFSRKQNARRSLLHRRPISRYIDLFLNTRSKIKGSSVDISTRQQQYDLHRARLIFHKYVSLSRNYIRIEYYMDQESRFSNELIRRFQWQRKLHFYIFGGNRSRSNSLYSQQYVGNLQVIRRLFFISWSPIDLSRFWLKKRQIFRRKRSLDQRMFDKQKIIFEHEELGKSFPKQIQPIIKKDLSLIDSSIIPIDKIKCIDDLNYFWTTKKRFLPDSRVEIKPLYVGWDNTRHTLSLCNRFIPLEWSIRTKLLDKWGPEVASDSSLSIKDPKHYQEITRREFRVWPKNFQTRRIRFRNIRYDMSAAIRRRVRIHSSGVVSLLAQDRRAWRRERNNWDTSQFAFWLNPHSSAQREMGKCGSLKFPLSFERTFYRLYTPGNLQPSVRGGFIWPGTDYFNLVQKSDVVLNNVG
jgi:hypothetical protein